MSHDPYHLDLDEITGILHPSEAIKRMSADAAILRVQLRCKVFNLSNDDDIEDYEKLLTEFANGMSKEIVKQETHFNKFGEYIVALHWKERVKKDDK
jgi:hypothetical protein